MNKEKALSLWEGRERRRAEILAAVDEARLLIHGAKAGELQRAKKRRSLQMR